MRGHGWLGAVLCFVALSLAHRWAQAEQAVADPEVPGRVILVAASSAGDTSGGAFGTGAEPIERLPEVPLLAPGGASPLARELTLADVRRRLEATEAELAQLRVEQARILPPPWPWAPAPATASGTSEMGVEDRIANLVRRAGPDAGFPLVRLSGFFQLDTGFFGQDAASQTALGNIQNGTGFRRTRLQALGKVAEFTNYSVELDFSFPGRPSFMDVWGEQTNLPIGNLRIGQYRLPVTMDSWTSVRHLDFLERSAPFNAFDPFRRVGIMDWYVTESGRTLMAASVFGTDWTFTNTNGQTEYNSLGIDNRYGTSIGNVGGVGIATRMTHLLYYDEPSEGRYLLHVGGGYTFAEIGGNGTSGNGPGTIGSSTYRASSIPEFFVGDSGGNSSTLAGTPNVLDTGRFLANSYSLYHLELAGNAGSLHWQSEVLGTAVAQRDGPLVYYGGAYAQCGYFLTGESAGYNRQAGALDYNCRPFSELVGLGRGRRMCGWGAWELAARWSYLDLQTNRVTAANYTGAGTTLPALAPTVNPPGVLAAGPSANANPNPGVLNESTVALNWYWNAYARVQFNWIHNMLSSQYRAYSVMDIWTIRYQLEF